MHRVVINFGCARQVGRTTAMLAIFQSILENLQTRDINTIHHILYITKREDDAMQLAKKVKTKIYGALSSRLFKGSFNKTTFAIVPYATIDVSYYSSNTCKCPNCGFIADRKKAVVFLDGTTDKETYVRQQFPESEWDLDLYLAN